MRQSREELIVNVHGEALLTLGSYSARRVGSQSDVHQHDIGVAIVVDLDGFVEYVAVPAIGDDGGQFRI